LTQNFQNLAFCPKRLLQACQLGGSVTLRTVSAVIVAAARETKKANGLHLIRFQELGVDQMIHSL